jgi:hypothetical protein
MKGIHCKDLGENMFLFTFHQFGGWRKAMEGGGAWMFENELLVLEEFDPSKGLDEYTFTHVSIWVRVYKLPLGKMTRDTAVLIGDGLGEFMEVDGMENGVDIG